jgi:RNA polymerase sigma factor (sigma-70 family)
LRSVLHNEHELLNRVAEGDENAFSEIITYYTPIIYKQSLLYVKNVQLAEEITQDVFLGIWNNRRKLAGMENFAGYLYVAARNRIKMAFREKILEYEQLPEDLLKPVLTPDKLVEYKELFGIMLGAIELLPPRRLEVFKLSRLENKTYDEIATQLQISKSAVKQHIIEALVFLRTHLKNVHDITLMLPFLIIYL